MQQKQFYTGMGQVFIPGQFRFYKQGNADRVVDHVSPAHSISELEPSEDWRGRSYVSLTVSVS